MMTLTERRTKTPILYSNPHKKSHELFNFRKNSKWKSTSPVEKQSK